jgi:hypothetical protein
LFATDAILGRTASVLESHVLGLHHVIQAAPVRISTVADTLAGMLRTVLDYPGVGLEHMVLRPNSTILGAAPAPT